MPAFTVSDAIEIVGRPAGVLAAEFTEGGRNRHPRLTFTRIENGRRTVLESQPVASRRDARSVAAERGATCWNF